MKKNFNSIKGKENINKDDFSEISSDIIKEVIRIVTKYKLSLIIDKTTKTLKLFISK